MNVEPIYQWHWIAQGATVAVDVTGWDRTDTVVYRATPYPLGSDSDYPSGRVSLRRETRPGRRGGETHTAVVRNCGPFHPCAVDLSADLIARPVTFAVAA